MKNITAILATLFVVMGHAQTIKPEKAKDYAGKKVTICGLVADIFASTKGQAPTFLHFGGKYPNNSFSVVVYKSDAPKFTYPLGSLGHRNICVTGYIKMYKGKPEMTVNSPTQIVVNNAPKK